MPENSENQHKDARQKHGKSGLRFTSLTKCHNLLVLWLFFKHISHNDKLVLFVLSATDKPNLWGRGGEGAYSLQTPNRTTKFCKQFGQYSWLLSFHTSLRMVISWYGKNGFKGPNCSRITDKFHPTPLVARPVTTNNCSLLIIDVVKVN